MVSLFPLGRAGSTLLSAPIFILMRGVWEGSHGAWPLKGTLCLSLEQASLFLTRSREFIYPTNVY